MGNRQKLAAQIHAMNPDNMSDVQREAHEASLVELERREADEAEKAKRGVAMSTAAPNAEAALTLSRMQAELAAAQERENELIAQLNHQQRVTQTDEAAAVEAKLEAAKKRQAELEAKLESGADGAAV